MSKTGAISIAALMHVLIAGSIAGSYFYGETLLNGAIGMIWVIVVLGIFTMFLQYAAIVSNVYKIPVRNAPIYFRYFCIYNWSYFFDWCICVVFKRFA